MSVHVCEHVMAALEAVDRNLASIRNQDANIELQISQLQRLQQENQIRISTLAELRNQIIAQCNDTTNLQNPRHPSEVSPNFRRIPTISIDERPSPTQAIRSLLSSRPGLTQREIVDFLEDKTNSTGKEVGQVLRTCLSQLKAAGKVIEYDDGKLRLVRE